MTTQLADQPPPTTKAASRVFIVDDHPIFRNGLARVIDAEADLKVCGEATTAPAALDALRTTEAEAVVVDISLPGSDGVELIKNLRAEHPDLAILVVSAHDEQLYALRALRAGGSGYVMKRESDTVFLDALRKVLAGGVYVSPTFGEQLIYKVARGAKGEPGGSPLEVLTDRELEILRLVGQGKATRDIAEELHLSVKTVESHRLHIKDKLDFKTASEMVRFALEFVAHQES